MLGKLINTWKVAMNFEKWQHYLRAQLLQFLGKNDAAIAEYQQTLLTAPDFARAAERIAFIYADRGDFNLAATHFLSTLQVAPDNAEMYFNLGFAYDKCGNIGEAIIAFQHAARLKPTLDRAWYGLGICQAKLGKHDEAAKALHEAATLQPMNPHAWYALGMAHHHLHQPERVTEIVMHLHRFDPITTRHLIKDTERSDLTYLVADLVV
jgi:tetratricopeptide (TPR) repeat protein